MDTTRWETEALRSGTQDKPRPPKPSAKRRSADVRWVTLREAEEATGIPVNTLRKWVRRADLPSYLESDGDIALRMVDLDAVERRARELGRELHPKERTSPGDPESPELPSQPPTSEPDTRSEPVDAAAQPAAQPDTMIVPLDAWNKMLAQLGNLHEAGQQLAEARERAAKAETEAAFLRTQLADLRSADSAEPVLDLPEQTPDADEAGPSEEAPPERSGSTTTYWRMLTARVIGRRGRD